MCTATEFLALHCSAGIEQRGERRGTALGGGGRGCATVLPLRHEWIVHWCCRPSLCCVCLSVGRSVCPFFFPFCFVWCIFVIFCYCVVAQCRRYNDEGERVMFVDWVDKAQLDPKGKPLLVPRLLVITQSAMCVRSPPLHPPPPPKRGDSNGGCSGSSRSINEICTLS